MNKNLQQPFLILVFAFFLIAISAFNSSHPTSGGMGRTGAPGDGTCLDCHNPASGSINGSVVIDGIPATSDVGTTYNLSITANISSGSPTKAGFQVVALLDADDSNAGTWMNNSSNTSLKMAGGKFYFGHQASTNFNGNSFITWTADWTAPNIAAGQTITFYAVTNLCNGNGGTSGDRVKFSTFTTTVNSTSDPLTCNISSIQDVDCNGDSDGSAMITGAGGDGNYDYEWDNGETTQTATGLDAGNHSATITDGLGATSTCNIMINEPNPLVINLNITDALCFDSNLGTANTNVTGGTSNYTYTWSNGETDAFLIDLAPGNYSLTVTDQNLCAISENFTIEGPNTPLITTVESLTNASCPSSEDGTISVLSTGGTGSTYNYFWPHNNSTNTTQTNLSAGTYSVETTDDNNCFYLLEITISSNDLIAPSLSQDTFDIFLNEDGMASFDSELLNNYIEENCALDTFIIDIPTYNCDNIGYNQVPITINDEAGNTSNLNITFQVLDTIPPVLSCPNDRTSSSCDPITYGLPIQSDNCSIGDLTLLSGLESGSIFPVGTTTITYMMVDLSGNADTCSFQITINLDLETTITTTDVECNGSNNGTANVSINGGTPPYTIETNNVNLDSLFAGSYPIVITDSLGCIIFDTINIDQPDILEATAIITHVSCFNYSDGSVEFNIDGGTAPYEINFTNNIDYNMLPAATYTFDVLDANLCVITGTVTITEPSPLLLLNPIITNASSTESADGSIQLVTIGGIEPYQYTWTIGDSLVWEESFIENALPGTYICTVIDSNGCSYMTMPLVIDFESTVFNNDLSKSINIYPNPSQGAFTVEILETIDTDSQIRIFNGRGEKQMDNTIEMINNRLEINLSDFAKGLYFIEVKNNGKAWIEKVLIF